MPQKPSMFDINKFCNGERSTCNNVEYSKILPLEMTHHKVIKCGILKCYVLVDLRILGIQIRILLQQNQNYHYIDSLLVIFLLGLLYNLDDFIIFYFYSI